MVSIPQGGERAGGFGDASPDRQRACCGDQCPSRSFGDAEKGILGPRAPGSLGDERPTDSIRWPHVFRARRRTAGYGCAARFGRKEPSRGTARPAYDFAAIAPHAQARLRAFPGHGLSASATPSRPGARNDWLAGVSGWPIAS